MLKNTIVLSILGTIVMGCSTGAIYCYGRTQYYQGHIDVRNEILREMEKVEKELYEKYGLTEKEKA